jgi:hypothetical protein
MYMYVIDIRNVIQLRIKLNERSATAMTSGKRYEISSIVQSSEQTNHTRKSQ